MIKMEPRTKNQSSILELSNQRDGHLVITGPAGTGKTILSCYVALKRVLSGDQDRVVICRTVVPSRDMGFIPGTVEEKQAPYEEPYRDAFNQILGRGDGYELLKKSGTLEFTTSSFLRGVTMRRARVIVDESQNWAFRELDTVMTRAGDDTIFTFIGDEDQTDFTDDRDKHGFTKFVEILEMMPSFTKVEMCIDDVVRSSTVREYLTAKRGCRSTAVHGVRPRLVRRPRVVGEN